MCDQAYIFYCTWRDSDRPCIIDTYQRPDVAHTWSIWNIWFPEHTAAVVVLSVNNNNDEPKTNDKRHCAQVLSYVVLEHY